jgi:hypothetical protein
MVFWSASTCHINLLGKQDVVRQLRGADEPPALLVSWVDVCYQWVVGLVITRLRNAVACMQHGCQDPASVGKWLLISVKHACTNPKWSTKVSCNPA